MVAGVAVWHELPTGMLMPAARRLVTFSVSCAVVRTVLVLTSTVPVAWPAWTSSVVAVTGMIPSSRNDPVAGGSVRVPVRAEVVRSAVAASVPGPRATVELIALMKVLPVTGYVTLISVSAAAGRAARAGGAVRPIPAAAEAEASSSVSGLRMVTGSFRRVRAGRCRAGGFATGEYYRRVRYSRVTSRA